MTQVREAVERLTETMSRQEATRDGAVVIVKAADLRPVLAALSTPQVTGEPWKPCVIKGLTCDGKFHRGWDGHDPYCQRCPRPKPDAEALAHELLGEFCACYAEAWPADTCATEAKKLADRLTAAPAQPIQPEPWKALEEIAKMRKSIETDVRSAHSGRGNGASQWMREDDNEFRRDLAAAFDAIDQAIASKPPASPAPVAVDEGVRETLRPLIAKVAGYGWNGVESSMFRITSDQAKALCDLDDALAAPLPPVEREWRPIESAPMDGATFLGWGAGNVVRTYKRYPWGWGTADNHSSPNFDLTHWMPLPASPSVDGGEG